MPRRADVMCIQLFRPWKLCLMTSPKPLNWRRRGVRPLGRHSGCKLAHAFRWECSHKMLELARRLGRRCALRDKSDCHFRKTATE